MSGELKKTEKTDTSSAKKSKKTSKGKMKIEKSNKPTKEKIKIDQSDRMRFGQFIDSILKMDRKKATKFIVGGIIIAIIFGTIALTSKSVASNAGTWANVQNQQNRINYYNGLYGVEAYNERSQAITQHMYWMEYQQVIFGNIGRFGVNISLIFVLLGFIGYTSDEEMDRRMRLISLVLAGVVVSVILFTMLFTNISVNIS